jgi:hypothetical protein
MPAEISSHEGKLLASILEGQGRQLARIDDTLTQVSKILENLGRLEERQAETTRAIERAFEAIADKDTRLKVVEIEVPSLKEVRRWVITGVLSTIGILVVGLANGTITIGHIMVNH